MKGRGRGVHKPQTSSTGAIAKSAITQRQEIAERERAESELRRLSRALLTTSQCNRAVVRAQSEHELLESVCRSLVEAGGYRMAWVGYAEQDAAKQVRPVAHAGFEEGYLSSVQITWGEDEHGRGPTGRAIRSGRPEINRLTQTDDTLSPWREEALKRGYLSSISLPLRSGGQTLGALTLYTEEPEAFDQNEVKLLSDLAEDLSFGIDTLRTRAERARAEEARQASEVRFRTLIEEAPVAIRIARNMETLYINRMFRQMYGIQSVDEVMGKSALEQWAPESRAMVTDKARERALGFPAAVQYEGVGQRQDGSRFPAQITIASVDLPDGPANMAFLTDLTERKRTEEQLHLTQFSLEHSSDPVFWMDSQGRIVYVNEAACRSLGRSREELLSLSILDIGPSYSAESWKAGWEKLKARNSITLEANHRSKDGRVFPVEVTSNYLQFGGKEYAFAFARDITERKQADEALRNNEAKFRAIIENSRDGILFADAENKIIYRSPSYQLINGFTDEERLGHVGYETVHPGDVEALRRAWKLIVEHPGKTYEIADYRIRHKDGTWKWVESSAANLLANPHVGAIVVTTRDLTERRRAEEALRESETAFRTLAEAVPQLVWMCTPDGMNFYFNQRWVAYTGLTLEQSYGEGWNTPFHPDDKQAAWNAWSHATETGERYQVESRLRAADGSYRWFLMRGEPLRDTAQRVTKWFGTCTDIDELRQAAEALQREKAFTEAVIDSFPDVFFVIQETGKFLHWGRNPEKVLGYTHAETMAMESALGIVAEEDRPLAARGIQEAFAQGNTAFEVHLLHRDGRKIPYLVRATRAVIGPQTYMVGFGLDITERKRAEDALKESEARFRTTFESAGIGIALVDVQGRPIQSNPALQKIIGYTAAELSRMAFTEFTHPDDRERDWDLYLDLMEGKRNKYEIEKRYVRKDGQLVWGLLTVSLVRDLQGQPQYAVGMVQDITERKRAEAALRQSEASLRDALMAAQMGMWNWTVATDTVTWDENLCRIAGRDNTLPPPNYRELSHIYTPESWERLKSAVENTLTAGTPYALDLEMLRADGSKRWVISRGDPVRDVSGHISQLRGTVQDITERVQAEQRIRSSEEKFRKAFMTGADSFHIARLEDGKILEVNDASQQVFGYTREEMIGKTALELGLYMDPVDRQRMVSEVMAHGFVKNMELQGRRKNGELIYALLSVSQILGDGEDLILGVARDITDKKRAEEALREREVRLKEAEKLAHLGSSIWDVATDTTTWSDELYRIVGRNPDLPPPKHQERTEIYTPESWERLEIAVRQALATGAPYDLELDVVRPDGTKRHVHARGVAERASDGSILRLQGTLQDVTEHHRLEQQFRQAQKMEAVGRLAGGVAHDFNNLLTVINGYSEMTLESLGAEDPKRAYISEVRKAGERAAGLTGQLLAFSRQQVLAPRVLDLNAVIANMEKMLKRMIGEDVDLAVVQGPALGQVKADPGQIEQIIMNLAVNARDAMPHGGKLVITTTNAELDETDIEKVPSVVRGHYVMLAVSDTGVGMDAQTQAHIFEPFFTTKEPGKGTGLGLATVYGIVKQSGGYIWVYSVPGQGTTFKIYLPRVDEPSEPFLPSEADARALGGSETILLVEDEKELSALAVRGLQARG